MGNAPEVVRKVGVNDFGVASKQQRFHLDHRLLGVAPGTVSLLLWWKVGFEGLSRRRPGSALAPASLLSCRLDHARSRCPVA